MKHDPRNDDAISASASASGAERTARALFQELWRIDLLVMATAISAS